MRGAWSGAVTHSTHVPFDRVWAFAGFRRLPSLARWAPLLVALPLAAHALVGRRAPPGPRAPRSHGWRLPMLAASVLGALAAWLLRVDPARNARFGDGPALAMHLEQRRGGFAAEALTADLFIGAQTLLDLLGIRATMRDAIELVTFACAGVFAAAAVDLGRTLGRSPAERAVIALGVATTGGAVQLLGYVETTCVAFAAIAVYLAAGARAAVSSSTAIGRSEVVAHCALGVALAAHAACISLLPSVLFLHARRGRGPCSATSWLLVLSLTFLPWLASAVLPHYARGELGNIEGGGDRNKFLPLEVDPLNLPSITIYYGLLDRLHRIELANAWAIGALAAPALALGALGVRCRAWLRRAGADGSSRAGRWAPELRRTLFFAVAAAGALSVVILWSFDFGLYGDWNIVTTYLLPLHVLGWSLVPALGREPPSVRDALAYGPLLVAQIGMWIGWYAQFA